MVLGVTLFLQLIRAIAVGDKMRRPCPPAACSCTTATRPTASAAAPTCSPKANSEAAARAD